MTKKYILLLSALLFTMGCVGAGEDVKLEPLQGIIGGTPTNFERFQGVVFVIGGEYCTGTLIHPRVVLTAAHCVQMTGKPDYTESPSGVEIKSGADVLANSPPHPGEVVGYGDEIIVHPDWAFVTGTTDLALIKLDTESDLETYKLREFPSPEVDSMGKIVGYGGSYDGFGRHRDGDTTLLEVTSFIEMGDPTNICHGDSGGPLFTEQDGQWVVTGVTSFNAGSMTQCDPMGGGYAVNMLEHLEWVEETMNTLVGEWPEPEGEDAGTDTDASPVDTDTGSDSGDAGIDEDPLDAGSDDDASDGADGCSVVAPGNGGMGPILGILSN